MNNRYVAMPPTVLSMLRRLLDAASMEELPDHITQMLQGLQAQLEQAGLYKPAEQPDDPMGVDPAIDTAEGIL